MSLDSTFYCLDYNPITSIYLYCGYHYWAFLGTWSQYLYYISRYVQIVYLSTNSLLVFISEECYVLSYPRLRFLGEGPCQRALFSNWWTTIWCHYYVCGLTPDGYVPTSIMAISWRSMAAPIGPWTTGLSGWTPALSLSITIYIL